MKRIKALISAAILAGAVLAIGVEVYPTSADAHMACCCPPDVCN